jgi:hypothetical protein
VEWNANLERRRRRIGNFGCDLPYATGHLQGREGTWRRPANSANMAKAELLYGRNVKLRRIAEEIIVTSDFAQVEKSSA